MGIFDKCSDTEKEIYRYKRTYSNDKYNNSTYNQNSNDMPNGYNNGCGMNNPLNQDNPNRIYVKPTKPNNIITVAFFILFFLLLLSPFLLSTLFNSADASNDIMPIIFLSLISLFGIFIAVVPIIATAIKKRRCKILLKAVVVDMKSRIRIADKGRKEYAPVYQYYYGGKEYIATESTYRNHPLTDIGDEIDILINETNPEDYYINDKRANLTSLVVGLGFALFPIILFFIIKY